MISSADIGPLVSVVMPAYKALYLGRALESLQRQTYRHLELVVCDDCREDYGLCTDCWVTECVDGDEA